MNFTDSIRNIIKRLFGADPIVTQTETNLLEEQNRRYRDLHGVNLTAIFAGKLSVLTVTESTADALGILVNCLFTGPLAFVDGIGRNSRLISGNTQTVVFKFRIRSGEPSFRDPDSSEVHESRFSFPAINACYQSFPAWKGRWSGPAFWMRCLFRYMTHPSAGTSMLYPWRSYPAVGRGDGKRYCIHQSRRSVDGDDRLALYVRFRGCSRRTLRPAHLLRA